MFKVFFTNVYAGITKFWNIIKNSRITKIGGKLINRIGNASVIITAFNAGNIMESVSHLTDRPVGIMDTARWMAVMCKDWVASVKARKFTWDVIQIFIPLVIALGYAGYHAIKSSIKMVISIMSTIRAKKTRNIPEKPQDDVVDVFA